MRGHVRKRGGLWAVVVDTPRDPLTGKRKQKWHSGFRTRRDAEKALAEVLTRLDQGMYVEPTKQTLSIFFEEWFGAIESTIRPSTFATYKTIVRKQLLSRLGTLPLQGLTAARLNALYAELLSSGRADGKGGLSPSSVRYLHAVIRKALSDAMRWNLLTRNVADAADPPRIARTQMKTWSAREVRTFLDHVKDDRLHAAFVLAATTGMRRGGSSRAPLARPRPRGGGQSLNRADGDRSRRIRGSVFRAEDGARKSHGCARSADGRDAS